MSRIPITVCIIAKNEEKFIGECLSRLKPYGFEIIVTDTGSTDKTVEIAQKYADKVLHFKWVNDFSKARNFCASHSSNEWILALDCDEFVDNLDVKELTGLIEKNPEKTGVIRIKNLANYKDGTKGYSTCDIIRLYNKRYYSFDYAIHEQVCSYSMQKRKEVMQSFLIPISVIHHGYALDEERTRQKQQRNLELLLDEANHNSSDSYLNFQIGQSYQILGEYEKSIDYYAKALEENSDMKYLYVQENLIGLARSYAFIGEKAKSLEVINQYAEQIKSAKLTFLLACALYENEEYMKAQLYFLKTTMLPDFETLGADQKRCYQSIIELYEAMDDQKMADLFKEKLGRYEADIRKVLKSS